MSSSIPLVFPLPTSPPGGHWAADPMLQPRLCSQMLACPEAAFFPWHHWEERCPCSQSPKRNNPYWEGFRAVGGSAGESPLEELQHPGRGCLTRVIELRLQPIGKLSGHIGPVMCLTVNQTASNHDLVVTGSKDHYVKVLSLENRALCLIGKPRCWQPLRSLLSPRNLSPDFCFQSACEVFAYLLTPNLAFCLVHSTNAPLEMDLHLSHPSGSGTCMLWLTQISSSPCSARFSTPIQMLCGCSFTIPAEQEFAPPF